MDIIDFLHKTDRDKTYLLTLLYDEFSFIPEIYDIFGKEGLLKFISVFSGESFDVPTRETLEYLARGVRIYVETERVKETSQYREQLYRDISREFGWSRQKIFEVYREFKDKIENLEFTKIIDG